MCGRSTNVSPLVKLRKEMFSCVWAPFHRLHYHLHVTTVSPLLPILSSPCGLNMIYHLHLSTVSPHPITSLARELNHLSLRNTHNKGMVLLNLLSHPPHPPTHTHTH
eukprot:c12470_g2_i1 orf=3-320(-)